MSESATLEVCGVSKRFGRTVALDGVTLRAVEGEVHAILGENGAGKSTLMKILAGVLRPDSGTVRLGSEPFAPRNPHDAREQGVAIVHQEPELCLHLTVEENLLLGQEPTVGGILRASEIRARALAALAQVVGDEGVIAPDIGMDQLAPAQRQLVAIARALVAPCRVLILDEPTSSLTAADAERLLMTVRRLASEGLCVLYISHFLEEVKRVADRFTVLRDGATVGTGEIGQHTMSEIVRLMVGQDLSELYPRSEREAGEVLLSVVDLSGPRLPRQCSFELHRGEVLGIAGLVGAGRTELLRAIFGLDSVVSGKLKLGALCGPSSPATTLAAGMGMVSEDRQAEGLALSMSVADNLTLSKLGGLGPMGLVLPERQAAAAQPWIERLAIRCEGPRSAVSSLSGGNQQKVALARLLHHEVDVLLLDEPTRGIDVASRAEIYRLIDQLAHEGRGVLVVSSYLPELFGICDKIAVMRRGRLGRARPVAELEPHSVLVEATGA